jgi:hypothetical protein
MVKRTKRQSGTKASSETGGSDSSFNAADLKERLLHRPAIKAVIWGMPAPNDDLVDQTIDGEDLLRSINQAASGGRLQ